VVGELGVQVTADGLDFSLEQLRTLVEPVLVGLP